MSNQSREVLRAANRPIKLTPEHLYQHSLRCWAMQRYLQHPGFRKTADNQDPEAIVAQQQLFIHVCREIQSFLPSWQEMITGQTYAVRQPFISMPGSIPHTIL